MELIVATRNKKKLKEIRELLHGLPVTITSLADYSNLPVILEDGLTFQENAIKKASTIAQYLKKLTLGEDSGLEVKALHGKPGVFSARYSGNNATDETNNAKLLRDLRGVPLKKRRASYVCSIAIADAHRLIGTVEARCGGLIAFNRKGSAGFGYDPLFLIPKFNKTFGQLGEKIKHTMSHRFKACKRARRIIEKYCRAVS